MSNGQHFYNDVYRYAPEKVCPVELLSQFETHRSQDEWRRFTSPTCPGPRSAHAVVGIPVGGGKLFLFGRFKFTTMPRCANTYLKYWFRGFEAENSLLCTRPHSTITEIFGASTSHPILGNVLKLKSNQLLDLGVGGCPCSVTEVGDVLLISCDMYQNDTVEAFHHSIRWILRPWYPESVFVIAPTPALIFPSIPFVALYQPIISMISGFLIPKSTLGGRSSFVIRIVNPRQSSLPILVTS